MDEHLKRLLNNIEDSRIDRRQLMRRLGFGAVGAAAAAAWPTGLEAFGRLGQARPSSPKAFPVTTMNHLSYAVIDWVKTRDFYVDVFNMRVAWDDGKGCALEFGSMTSPEGLYIRPRLKPGEKGRIDHFAFGIPDITKHLDAMKVEMERWGLKNIRPDGEHGWIADDPAGYMLNTWVPEKSPAMFPGAASPCKDAESAECKNAFEAGLKNLDKVPKPSGKGLVATSFSHVVLRVPRDKIAAEKEFYRDLMGMKVIHDAPDAVFLRYGKNSQLILPTPNPSDAPYSNHFGLVIENFDAVKVEAELKRRGLDPKPFTKLGWTITDPNGVQVDVCGWGVPEHLAQNCKGAVESCPESARS